MPKQKDLAGLCRLCLKESCQLVDIFGENDSNSSLVMRIMASVSLEVHKNDSLPKKICASCRYQLEKTYVFRSKCRNNDIRLRRHMKLVAVGKSSSLLEVSEDDDDEDEFEQSLQYIRLADSSTEEERLRQWEEKVAALEQEFQAMADLQRASMYDEIRQDVMINHQENRLDVGVMTETCEVTSVPGRKRKRKATEVTKIELPPDSPSQSTSFSPPVTIESAKKQIRARIHARLAEQDHALIEMIQENTVMEMDEVPEQNESPCDSQSIEILNEDQTSYVEEELPAETLDTSPADSYLITEVSDSEAYLMDNDDLRREEQELYGTMEDSDTDLDVVTTAVKAELAERPNLKVDEDCVMRVEKDRDCTKVEVQATDGSVICMEFSTDRALNRKQNPVQNYALHSCPNCTLVFKTRAAMQAHHKQNNCKTFACKICKKLFNSQSSVQRHIRTHTGEKPFACDECGKGFTQKEVLKRHMYLHAEERPFGCDHCDKRFNQKDQLKMHVAKNHTENPVLTTYDCSICSKSFRYASGLSRHFATHSGRTYICACGRSFNDQSALKRHEMVLHKKAMGSYGK